MSDVVIQYCGPYSIQTSDASMSTKSVESVSLAIERETLRDYEQPEFHEVKQKLF